MAALRNFNGLVSWRNAENSLQSVNVTIPTRRIRDALKTIEVTLLHHVIVTPTGSLSFRERDLL